MYGGAGPATLVPPAVVTVTATVPPPGRRDGRDFFRGDQFERGRGRDPELDARRSPKFFPVIVTFVPPPVDPEDGDSAVTYGSSWV